MENQLIKIESSELEKVVKESGLAIQEGEEIKQSYQPFLIQLAEIQSQAGKINFDNPQPIDETIARELRLKTVKIRTGAGDLKDSRKRIYLLRGNLEQAAYNLIAASCKLTEETFGNVEKAREIAEKKRKEILKAERIEKLLPYGVQVEFYDLANMPDENFTALLEGFKKAYEERIAAEKKAEEERIAKEKAEAEERERIRIENERLKKEAEEKEKELAAERAKVEAERKAAEAKAEEVRKAAEAERKRLEEIARKEREAAEAKLKAEQDAARKAAEKAAEEKRKLEAELKAKEEAEKAAKKAEQDRIIAEEKERRLAEKKAAAAPDKSKLIDLANMIDQISKPVLKTPEAIEILNNANGLLLKVSAYIREKSSNL